MGKIVVVNEDYLAKYHQKRSEYNKLKEEVDEMSETIKLYLEKNYPLGKSWGRYVACLSIKNKLNANFIKMLKDNGMGDRVKEVCYIKDCKDITSEFTLEDENKYYDFWYKQLVVKKLSK